MERREPPILALCARLRRGRLGAHCVHCCVSCVGIAAQLSWSASAKAAPPASTMAFDLTKVFNTSMTTPQLIVIGLVMLYVLGGGYIVLTTKAAKEKAKKVA